MQLSLLYHCLPAQPKLHELPAAKKSTCERPVPLSKAGLSTICLANRSSLQLSWQTGPKPGLPPHLSGERRCRSSNPPEGEPPAPQPGHLLPARRFTTSGRDRRSLPHEPCKNIPPVHNQPRRAECERRYSTGRPLSRRWSTSAKPR